MNNQSQDEQQPAFTVTKRELLERIQRSRLALEEIVNTLSAEQLATPGPEGWTVKDHLAHVATWELGIAELLQGRPRFPAMQVEQAILQKKNADEINALIYRNNASLSLADVQSKFRAAHEQMLRAINSLEDEDLIRPYASFLAEGSTPPSGSNLTQPVLQWIVGNTFGHFDEHHDYIQELIRKL